MKTLLSTPRTWRLSALLATSALVLPSAAVLAPAASALGPFAKLSAEMTEPRYAPAVATLPDGKVLVSGGYPHGGPPASDTAELFDPASGTFTKLAAAPTLGRGEACHATLADGRVLIAGGANGVTALKSAEVFNPKTEAFETVGEMAIERDGCAAATLPDGNVLIVDGVGNNKASNYKQAELFDPTTNTFHSIPAESLTGLYWPAAVSLADGKVLVAGGYKEPEDKVTANAELFDPTTSKFELTTHELLEPREEAGYLPAYGGALLLGGYDASYMSSVELFNGGTGLFEKIGSELTEHRDGDAAARLQNGSVLVLGGYIGATYLRSAETAPRSLLATTGGSPTAGTVSGTVLAEIPTSARFQYGTSTAYGSSTTPQALTPSTTPSAVGATLSGLLAGTTYHYRLVAEDGGGPIYGADMTFTTVPPPVPVVHTAPVIASASESHSRWREGSALAAISSRRKRAPIGTTFSLTLNEQATMSLTFTRRVGGREAKGKCVTQTKTNRHRHACVRMKAAGAIALSGHGGADKISFQGRISSSGKLPPGTYVVTIVAVNSFGQRSAPQQLTFTIVK